MLCASTSRSSICDNRLAQPGHLQFVDDECVVNNTGASEAVLVQAPCIGQSHHQGRPSVVFHQSGRLLLSKTAKPRVAATAQPEPKRERQPPESAYVRPVESGGDAPIRQLGLATPRIEGSPIACGGELLQVPADRIPPGALTLPTCRPSSPRRSVAGLAGGRCREAGPRQQPLLCCWVAGAGGRLKMLVGRYHAIETHKGHPLQDGFVSSFDFLISLPFPQGTKHLPFLPTVRVPTDAGIASPFIPRSVIDSFLGCTYF